MTGLDCPMQIKALNLFWHKAELRLVEQPEPEAPVFAISRPTLFGGREEFILQYPARLEPPSERDIARHRFTVRHGKKRRSFQAPDASTFDTWLSALEQVLEPKTETEHFSTPSTTTSNATTATSSQGRATNATNSLGRVSTAGSAGTRVSSRGWANSTLDSDINSHSSQPRAPALRLTLERPCFTRDPNNLKLIRLHRPASTITGAEGDEDKLDVIEADPEVEVEPEVAVTKLTELTDNEDDLLTVEVVPSLMTVASSSDNPVDNYDEVSSDVEPLVGEYFEFGDECVFRIDEEINSEVITGNGALVDALASEQTCLDDDNDIAITGKIDSEVKEWSAAVVETNAISTATCTESTESIDPEVASSHEACVGTCSSNQTLVASTTTRSTTLKTKHNWVPLDPNNSKLIWVRCSVAADVKSASRSNSKRKPIKPVRRWVPLDPSSTRLLWIRRVDHAAARIESRYKATSSTRKWAPLDPENSKFIWVQRSVAPVDGVAIPKADSSSSRLYRHDKQRRH
ncbi:Hypothetical protein PHPALM_4951 [Phytophthora palmivora]|uniref:PH domain-containing protein n=1 Tax=Phytophthora palmivora TaxID=4796 RepID=A0A2P4YIL2_9STRA|nr:Hypothetical protein PHPALM_4951 [Phytophthora palmivora]